MATKNITLTGAEVAVSGLDGAHAHIRNDSAAAIYAAKSAGITAGADGVLSIPAGASATVYSIPGTVYLLGNGAATVISSDYTDSPFRNVSNGGAADIVTDAAASVTLNGLQGGVPFSDITLSGDIVGKEIKVAVCENNIPLYPFYNTTKTANGLTFTDNGDGSVTVNGTATATTPFFIIGDSQNVLLPHGDYFLIGTPTKNGTPSFSSDPTLVAAFYDENTLLETIAEYGGGKKLSIPQNATRMTLYIRIPSGITVNNAVFRPKMYEMNHGTVTTINPDIEPYNVMNDIRQLDGLNNVIVSEGEVSVTGVKRDAALKKIWDKLDELTAAIIVSNGETAE